MDVKLKPGKYVVAVSGGVDSMVLLDVLRRLPDVQLVIAHFEHGIRQDSIKDKQLVQATAKKYKLPFVCAHGHLGREASEATARDARYAFLRSTQRLYNAQAIITAHHQDDVLETAILNLARGTGRKGLSSLQSTQQLVRPLLHIPKRDIVQYAHNHHIAWHEDSTNRDDRYLRNHIRHHIVPRLGQTGRQRLLQHIQKAHVTNTELDSILLAFIPKDMDSEVARLWFTQLPHALAMETMATWLRRNGVAGFDKKLINRLVVMAKTASPGKVADIDAKHVLRIGLQKLQLTTRDS
ncbi:MAG TPA: tRNA lysidine(34) synthetase TilS [Nevskiaceae bacterium]|nr:tRNA lysidine(34) synthetase TilS [Nevskiaceae bacterium]